LSTREKQLLELTDPLYCRRSDEDLEGRGEAARACLEEESAPNTVTAVERYQCDLGCLSVLTLSFKPPKQLYRAKHQAAFFLIGDASGKGKGNAVVEQYGVDYESGAWNLEWRDKSSNCREAENLTDQLERLVAEGALQNHEVFLLTDSSAFEGAYYKGHSLARQLSDIVFRVHKAEQDGGFILHVIHIAGKRMKATGVDGLSQGDLTEGLMAGQDPLSFVPFNKGADERSSGLVSAWVQSWWSSRKRTDFGGLPLRVIDKDIMFELQDLKEARLWMPPPALMEVASELLSEDRLAHPQWPHVFVVPCLMTQLWRKNLMKGDDVLFTVPADVLFWTSGQFEPLIVAINFPLSHVLRYRGPWMVKRTDKGKQAERELHRGFKLGRPDCHDAGELHELGGGRV
jgi:hypothetical protein